jgi:hypothetical protein
MLKFLNMPVCRPSEAGGLACILLASLFATALAAQTGEVDIDTTYFHPAASLYIHGDATGASNLVAKGLSVFPDDGKLLRLKDLLEQQQEQQQNEDNQQQDDQQQDQQDQQDDQQQDQQDQQQDQSEDQSEEQSQQPEPPSAEQMSADEAEQLLDAMRQEEQNKRLQLHPVLGAPVNVEKDW